MVGGSVSAGVLIKKQKPKFDNMLLYFLWNIWKERNRRTFEQTSLDVIEVASIISNDVKGYQAAETTTTRAQIGTGLAGQG
jgi:hypothetical protein